MKISINWTLLLPWIFLSAFILMVTGWYEFNWSLFKILPAILATLFLFFQSLTLNRFQNKRWSTVNRVLFGLQLILLLLFVTRLVTLNDLWKWNIFLLFIATQVYLIDLNERFGNNRRVLDLLFKLLVAISCLSFLLLSFSYELLTVGFTSMIISSILAIANIFFYKKSN